MTDYSKDVFLKNDARNGDVTENYVELFNSIFIEGNKLLISNTDDQLEKESDGLDVLERWDWLQHLFKPYLDKI